MAAGKGGAEVGGGVPRRGRREADSDLKFFPLNYNGRGGEQWKDKY